MTIQPLELLIDQHLENKDISDLLHWLDQEPVVKYYIEIFYYSFRQRGISLLFNKEEGELRTIFLYSQGSDNYEQYIGEIPMNLSFDLSRTDIHETLGVPSQTGGGIYVKMLNEIIAIWDKYIYDKYNIVITYDEQVELPQHISIGSNIDD